MADEDTPDKEEKENIPSELDELTHREVSLIYDDATRTILFAKGIQWKAVASSLLMFLVVIGLVKYISHAVDYVNIMRISVIFTSMAAILLLIIFQFWQHTEAQKLSAIEKLFSSAFRDIRKKKSILESSIHRYIIGSSASAIKPYSVESLVRQERVAMADLVLHI